MKHFENLIDIQKFLYNNGIEISISDLKYAFKTGYLFTDDYDFNCYYDDIENKYVLEV